MFTYTANGRIIKGNSLPNHNQVIESMVNVKDLIGKKPEPPIVNVKDLIGKKPEPEAPIVTPEAPITDPNREEIQAARLQLAGTLKATKFITASGDEIDMESAFKNISIAERKISEQQNSINAKFDEINKKLDNTNNLLVTKVDLENLKKNIQKDNGNLVKKNDIKSFIKADSLNSLKKSIDELKKNNKNNQKIEVKKNGDTYLHNKTFLKSIGYLMKYYHYTGNKNRPKGAFIREDHVREGSLDYFWGDNHVGSSGKNDNVYIEFSGNIISPITGNVTFYLDSDDGARFFIYKAGLRRPYGSVSRWRTQGMKGKEAESVTVKLKKGESYKFRLDHFEAGGGAGVRLYWNYKGISGRRRKDEPRTIHTRNLHFWKEL